MASKATSVALFFMLSLLFSTVVVSGCDTGCPYPKPKLKPGPSSCPKDTLKLGVCANVLTGLLSATLGHPPKEPCCSLIQGLVDVEAAVCLCTAIKANILGLNLDIPVSLSLLLNYCGHKVPHGFQCA